jgi:alpha-glucosidase (family GH31 glycosyl hydrolase)
MKWCVILLVLLSVVHGLHRPVSVTYDNNPVPNPAAVVTAGNARFTVLTSRMIRMEWSPNSQFDDRASFGVINRNLPVPSFSTSTSGSTLVIDTADIQLRYTKSGTETPPFSASNLAVILKGTDGIKTQWSAGDVNSGNLLGTVRTLDGVNGGIQLNCSLQTRDDLHCTFGLISTLGWNVFDESERPVYDDSPWPWCESRNTSAYAQYTDWYFMGHGLNFKQALADYTMIGGPLPLPPRFVFGLWWSRYWAFSDIESIELINEYEIHDTPLDVFVTDMDWHLTFYKEASKGKKDQAGQPMGWTGFTWDPNLFPNPKAFLDYCKSKGLKNTLNLHPASGVQPWEERYPEMANASGINPESQIYVPFQIENKTFAQNLWNIMLQPIEEQGIDFWWLDWQQGEDVTTVPGVNPTFWLNYVFFTNPDQWANEKRPMLFHRWGGLGNHRYQIGFTGDVVPSWASLQFQPYFTATAANVGFGYWSHDIGGHTLPSPPEIYTRWVQWGAFAPVLRTHCTKSPINDRRIWAYPLTNFFIMREAMKLRAELVPYIYTASRIAHDTGVPFLRSLYYDWPTQNEAYNYPQQYVFGDDIVVSPVTSPVDYRGLVEWNVWIPPGTWVEWFSGLTLSGPQIVTRGYALTDIPAFVRAGTVLPLVDYKDRPLTGGAQLIPNTLTFRVFACPGCSGSTVVYEDDGDTTQYQTNSSVAWTTVQYSTNGNNIQIQVLPVDGNFSGFPVQRNYRIKIQGTYNPSGVSFNGNTVPFDPYKLAVPSWSYDGNTLSVEVITAPTPVSSSTSVVVTSSAPLDDALYGGIPLAINRLAQVKGLLDDQWENVFQEDYPAVIYGASTGRRMSFNPSNVTNELAYFGTVFTDAMSQIKALTGLNATTQAMALALVASAQPQSLVSFSRQTQNVNIV